DDLDIGGRRRVGGVPEDKTTSRQAEQKEDEPSEKIRRASDHATMDSSRRVAVCRDQLCGWPLWPSNAASSCSKPPVSIAQCIPHSFGAPVSHHQRPDRGSWPSGTARVHGAHPIDL